MFNCKILLPVWINFIFRTFLHHSVLSAESRYETCRPKSCGNGPNISYPFYILDNRTDFCGHPGFVITCEGGWPIYGTSGDVRYIIRDIVYADHSLSLVNAEAIDDASCPTPLQDFSLDRISLEFSPRNASIFFFYNCTDSFSINYTKSEITCLPNDSGNRSFVMLVPGGESLNCSKIPCGFKVGAPVEMEERMVNQTVENVDYKKKDGFVMEWVGIGVHCDECFRSGGHCGFEDENDVCFCPDGSSHPKNCHDERNKRRLTIGLGFGVPAVVLILLSFLVFRHLYNIMEVSLKPVTANFSSNPSWQADPEEGGVYFGVPIFSYRDLKEATNNFDSKNELGDGGFGTVYYGKLRDGREVAVKRLYEHNCRRLEHFMNEIKILTLLHQKNLVSLYGCTLRHSRDLLLVYEYIPNGPVADHLHGARAKSSPLPWPLRMRIAMETATALAYLHASEIIHRDVKTNNILLDDDFHVKVVDFGLSRLFPNDVTHVSTDPQGTPGHVDPEYHQCYQLTDKSDVYSFGVVLIELISSMPAVDTTRHRHEINLANFAITKIQKRAFEDLIDQCLGYKSDEEVERMTTAVAELAFLCLQQDKDMRPSMDEVSEELKRIGSKDNKVHDDYNALKHTTQQHSPPGCDQDALLKNIQQLPSPDSVADKWVSSSSTTPNASV